MRELILRLGTLTVKSASVRAEWRCTPANRWNRAWAGGTLDLCLGHIIFISFSDSWIVFQVTIDTECTWLWGIMWGRCTCYRLCSRRKAMSEASRTSPDTGSCQPVGMLWSLGANYSMSHRVILKVCLIGSRFTSTFTYFLMVIWEIWIYICK